MISKVKPIIQDSAEDSDWYETWFNSPYYHILYKNRDEEEAESFLDALIRFIKPAAGARILDVACGKGRHSIYLNKKGFDVTGFDLSSASISHNKQFENENLTFYVHDMREVFRANYFDVVLNLFSSYGYFEKERDNERCLIANATALKKNGTFVFDYFNARIIKGIGNTEFNTSIDGINFHIQKNIEGRFIRKKIHFADKGKNFDFEEHLLLAEKKELENYFSKTGLVITGLFGNYQLDAFDENTSERLIIIASKK